jgi:hypothetical protein
VNLSDHNRSGGRAGVLGEQAPEDAHAALAALRDSLRSARDWRTLLSESDRRRMLADIAAVALAVGRDLRSDGGLSDLDIGDPEGGGPAPADPCPRERLAFLEALWPRLSGALRRIEAAPPAALAHETAVVPAGRARCPPTPAALMAALRTGDMAPAGAPALAARLPPVLAGRLPRLLTKGTRPDARHAGEPRRQGGAGRWAGDLGAIAGSPRSAGEPTVAERARRLRGTSAPFISAATPGATWSRQPPLCRPPGGTEP